MSVETEVVDDVGEDDDAEALAAAMAGYNARGANTPPADAPGEQTAESEEDPAYEPTHQNEAGQAAAAAVSLADELAALKEKVRASGDMPEIVRKMHGEIGNINRQLQQQAAAKPQPAPAPVDDELTAAIRDAESAAEEFPELAGPLVRALKAFNSKQSAAPTAGVSADQVQQAVDAQIKRTAIEALAEEHPDFETVRETKEFRAWEATKPPEYQARLRNTWNPAVVASGLSEFKATLQTQQQARQSKQNRLAAAVTPRGVAAPAGKSTIPDEEGFAIGYYGKAKRS